MFLDFDRFKLVNDSMGHSAGDAFLVQVARRSASTCARATWWRACNGDEFAVLCENLEREAHAVTLAERLQLVLGEPLQIGGTEIATSASIGITFSTIGYTAAGGGAARRRHRDVPRQAAGKARHALFDAGLHQQVSERARLEGDLRRAIEHGQLSVATSRCSTSAAAAHRTSRRCALAAPDAGPDQPGHLHPDRRGVGADRPLTDFVLDSACRQLKLWQAPRGPSPT